MKTIFLILFSALIISTVNFCDKIVDENEITYQCDVTVRYVRPETIREGSMKGNYQLVECLSNEDKAFLVLLADGVDVKKGDKAVYYHNCQTFLVIKDKFYKSYLQDWMNDSN